MRPMLPTSMIALVATFALAPVVMLSDARADTYAVNSAVFPLPNTNQLFPSHNLRISLKCVNPLTNGNVTLGYASGWTFVMAPGATLWELQRPPQGKITATGTAGQVLGCEELFQ